jgi:hypothetical protein
VRVVDHVAAAAGAPALTRRAGAARQLRVVRSEAAIKSIELQLVRVETCGCAEGFAKDGAAARVRLAARRPLSSPLPGFA